MQSHILQAIVLLSVLLSAQLTTADFFAQQAWEKALPSGCKPATKGKEPWCDYSEDKSRVVIRNVNRMSEVLKGIDKKIAEKGEKRSTDDEALALVEEAVLAAQTKYEESEQKKRNDWLKKAKKAKDEKKEKKDEKPPAMKIAKTFKCRKKQEKQELLKEYTCVVSDYTIEKDTEEDADSGKKKKESDEVRCERLKRWHKAYKKDKTEEKKDFWAVVTDENEALGELEKLRRHAQADDSATGAGKAKQAIELKTKTLYKTFAREQHPDKLPRTCVDDNIKEMAQAVFDRAADLKECVMKPMRCTLPEVKSRIDMFREKEIHAEGEEKDKKSKKKSKKGEL